VSSRPVARLFWKRLYRNDVTFFLNIWEIHQQSHLGLEFILWEGFLDEELFWLSIF
jgi:hypothetical protein